MRIEGKVKELRTKAAELGLTIDDRGTPMRDASDVRVRRDGKIVGRLFFYWRSGNGYLEVHDEL